MALTKIGKEGITGISNSSDATAVTIDSDENVSIGVTSKNSSNNGSLTIGHTGMTKISASASGNADELVLIGADASANVGMSIIANNGNQSNIFFGDEDDTDIGSVTYDHSNNSLKFTTTTAEAMRINADGHVYIKSAGTDPSASQVGVRISGTQGQNFWKSANSGTGGYNHLNFYNGNGEVGSIVTSGSNTAYNTSSDYRLKENVVTDWNATTRLKQLKPCRFNFIADKDTTVDGFLAHEVQSVVPEAISGEKDATNEDGSIKPQAIDQSKIVPLLVKTIQELEARITALESA